MVVVESELKQLVMMSVRWQAKGIALKMVMV